MLQPGSALLQDGAKPAVEKPLRYYEYTLMIMNDDNQLCEDSRSDEHPFAAFTLSLPLHGPFIAFHCPWSGFEWPRSIEHAGSHDRACARPFLHFVLTPVLLPLCFKPLRCPCVLR